MNVQWFVTSHVVLVCVVYVCGLGRKKKRKNKMSFAFLLWLSLAGIGVNSVQNFCVLFCGLSCNPVCKESLALFEKRESTKDQTHLLKVGMNK